VGKARLCVTKYYNQESQQIIDSYWYLLHTL